MFVNSSRCSKQLLVDATDNGCGVILLTAYLLYLSENHIICFIIFASVDFQDFVLPQINIAGNTIIQISDRIFIPYKLTVDSITSAVIFSPKHTVIFLNRSYISISFLLISSGGSVSGMI